jgi:hypothetical protein
MKTNISSFLRSSLASLGPGLKKEAVLWLLGAVSSVKSADQI